MFRELLEDDIKKGIAGKNNGVPTGFPKIDSNINGIQKSIYTLIGGNSGTGKTSYVDLAYVLNPYDWWIKNKDNTDIKLKWVYNSMERNLKYKLAKWGCLKLFRDHKIVMDVPTLLGWQGKKYKITPELEKLILEAGKYFDTMFESDCITIIEGTQNPTGIYNKLTSVAMQDGKLEQVDEFRRRYIPNDKELLTVVVNDHVGKLASERNFNDKELLDKHSEYMGVIRDRFGYSIVDISQFNRAIGNIQRMKEKAVSPEPDDFKGSGDMYENADVVLGLFNPFKLKINDFLGYNIPKFVDDNGENRFRSVSIIKNTYGADDVIIGLNFLGENGDFRELPSSDAFKDNPEYYEKARKFK